MSERRSKHLVLILAREFASNLATPMLIVDGEGMLVFFNEAAEEVLGGTFAELGEMSIDEFSARSRRGSRTTSLCPRSGGRRESPSTNGGRRTRS